MPVHGLVGGNDYLVVVAHDSSHSCWSSVAILQATGSVVPGEHSCWRNDSDRCPCVLVPLLLVEESTSFVVEPTLLPIARNVRSTMRFTLKLSGPIPPSNCGELVAEESERHYSGKSGLTSLFFCLRRPLVRHPRKP